jgi:ATP-dependent DNA helicase DinG
MADPSSGPIPLTLAPEAAEIIRAEIRRAGGREVTFLLEVAEGRSLRNPRAVARGNRSAVLAVSRDAPRGSLILHNHPSGLLEPSDADLAVAAALYEEGLGCAIVDNEAGKLYVVVEPPKPRVVDPLPLEEIGAFLGPEGALARTLDAFEDRPGQREMGLLVARRYNQGGVGLVEAGTGTGKSVAYLLPAALWALRNDERTVISTNTINLQEQLVGKDLPLLQEALGEPLTWTLVKGRGNYISIRRALLARASAPSLFEEDRTGEMEGLIAWMENTEDGSLADLSSPPSPEVWEEVQSDPDVCLRTRCPHFQSCFFHRARREAAAAKLLVVNHHLLFTDLAVRKVTNNYTQAAVLPPYRHLILDEAHNAEEAATEHLGVEVTRIGLFRLLSRLERRGKGILADLRQQLSGAPDRGTARSILSRLEERVLPGVAGAREVLDPFLERLEGALEGRRGDSVRLGGKEGLELRGDGAVREAMTAVLLAFRRLALEVGELRARIEADEAWAEALEGRLLDMVGVQHRLEASAQGIQRVLDPGEEAPDLVRWLQGRGRGRGGSLNLALAAAPIQVGPTLREDLFKRLESSVLTSATLTTRGRFDYLRSRLGLGEEALAESDGRLEVEETVVPSPFHFEEQSVLAVPTDLAGPLQEGDEFQLETAKVVADVATITGGGLFVLFTSYRALLRVAELLREEEKGLPGPLFVQGEAPRPRLLQGFTDSGHGILLGTASFWEGVDVPGDPLRGLIIQKLPFQVPTEPVVEARMEVIEAHGGDPFLLYSLPEAALRLKQGFGRLIRTREDRGAVLILDDRILTRRYGPYLRQSLPRAPLAKGPWGELRRTLRRFYEEG